MTPAPRAASDSSIATSWPSTSSALASAPSASSFRRAVAGSVDRERGVGELGGPQVDVRRVETVRLAGQRFVLLEGGAAVVGKPGGFVGGDAVDVLRGDDESEVVERPAHRPLPRSRRGPFGRCRLPGRGRHPSDPSISSFTSRLNSIAYSMGSSLVKTSRKPWTIRFVASFSVRPRLIR